MFPGPPGVEFQLRSRFPTQTLGEWLLLDAKDDGVKITFVSPAQARIRTFVEDCSFTTTEQAIQPAVDTTVGFTDHDLGEAVESASTAGSNGVVVYIWSPHMPLSVDGYAEIVEAARRAELQLMPLLFPGSDRAFAASEAQRVGVPDAGLREPSSVELLSRDALVHAPSIVVFGNGRVSAVLPGYRTAEGYREFLAEFVRPS